MGIRRTALIILILILALQVAMRLPFLHVPLERDEGAYGYMAQRILAGEVPYRDAFDHKPPLVYFVYALLVKFFGSSIEAIRIPTLIYSLGTTLALFYLAFLLWGVGWGLTAALLYAVFSGGVLIEGAYSNTETFMILPLILALIFFLNGEREKEEGVWFFWAGIFSGSALMFKQVAAFNLLVLFLFFFGFENKRVSFNAQNAVRLFLGCVVVPAIFVIYLLSQGAIPDFIQDVFIVNAKYVRSLAVPLVDRVIFGGLVTLFRASTENSLIWLFGVLGAFYVLLRERSREYLLLVCWALASFLGVVASGLFFGHYYIQLIPALCLLSAFALKKIREEGGILLKSLAVIGSLLLLLKVVPYQYPFYFKYTPDEISRAQYGKDSYVVAYHLAEEFKRVLKPEETILVWPANPELYFYINKKAPTRYFNLLKWMVDEEVKQEVISSILQQKPDIIVWTLYAFPYKELVDLIQKEYRFYLKMGSWIVFRRDK